MLFPAFTPVWIPILWKCTCHVPLPNWDRINCKKLPSNPNYPCQWGASWYHYGFSHMLSYNLPIIFNVLVSVSKHRCWASHVIVFKSFQVLVEMVRLLTVVISCLVLLTSPVIGCPFSFHDTLASNTDSTTHEAVTVEPAHARRGFSRRMSGLDGGVAAINKKLFTDHVRRDERYTVFIWRCWTDLCIYSMFDWLVRTGVWPHI